MAGWYTGNAGTRRNTRGSSCGRRRTTKVEFARWASVSTPKDRRSYVRDIKQQGVLFRHDGFVRLDPVELFKNPLHYLIGRR